MTDCTCPECMTTEEESERLADLAEKKMSELEWTTHEKTGLLGSRRFDIHRNEIDVGGFDVLAEFAPALCARIEGKDMSTADSRQLQIEHEHTHYRELEAERDELKAELTDRDEADKRILADARPKDEQHCYCVVPLRKEVERLQLIHGGPGMCCSCRYDAPPNSLAETECQRHQKMREENKRLREAAGKLMNEVTGTIGKAALSPPEEK